MKRFVFFLSALLFGFGQADAAVKPCEELRAEIAAKLDSKGIKGYELTIAANNETAGKVVGSCEDGSKKIVYFKQTAKPAQSKAATPSEESAQEQPAVVISIPQPSQEPVPVVAVKMIQVESDSAVKSCEELKTEIADKLAAKGVKNYELTVAARGKAEGKVVGSCESGSKQIVYTKK